MLDGGPPTGAARGVDRDDLVAVFGMLDAALFTVDRATLDVTLLGARSGELLGHPADTVISSEAFWALVPARERGELLEALRAVAADGVARSVEHPVCVAGRGEQWFRTCVRVAARGDAPARLLGAMLDVTHARLNEARWREVENWLVTLGEALPFDFWICDPAGRCVLQNPVSRRRRGSLLGRASPQWTHAFQRALAGESSREEFQSRVDGVDRHFVRIVAPARDGGDIQAVLGVEIDISELKHAEARLRESLAELARAQDSLVRKQRLAVLGEMAAAVAHEVRNPLGAISNALALLRKAPRPEPAGADLLRVIDEEVRGLDRLVANLLDSVRPLRTTLVALPLERVVDDALAHVLREAEAPERIRVARAVDPAVPAVLADVQLLGMAVTNVLRNALQAMPAGGELRVAIEREEASDGPWARLSIEDSGPGVPPQMRERIFDPFVTTRPTGSGLGLAIVRRVMEEHHGRVDIASEPGRGATCVMRLPLAEPRG